MSNLSPKDAVLNLKLQLWFEDVDGGVDGPNADRLKHRVRRVEGLHKQIFFENIFELKKNQRKKIIFNLKKFHLCTDVTENINWVIPISKRSKYQNLVKRVNCD